jgi:hypothetical protein
VEREAGEVVVAHEDVVVSGADVAEVVEEASRRGENWRSADLRRSFVLSVNSNMENAG